MNSIATLKNVSIVESVPLSKKVFFVSNLECFEQWLPLFSLADNSLSKFNNNWIIFLCPLSIWWSFNAILCNASHCWLHKTWPEHWSLEGPLLYGEFPELRSYKMRQNFSTSLLRLFSSNSDIVHKKRSFEIDLIKSYVKSQPSDCKTLSWWSIWRNWICAHWIGGNMVGRRQKWASIGSWSHCSWRIGTLASSHCN